MNADLLYLTRLAAALTFVLFSQSLSAQNPIQVVNTMTQQELVNALVNNDCASISSIHVTGSNGTSDRSYCFFTADNGFPFDSGIILSTGYAIDAAGPNNGIQSEGFVSWGGDADLEENLNISNTNNATVMEFDFIPATDHISFDYIFASEEYTGWTDLESCNFSDGFAFLLKEVGNPGAYQNLAVIPGTDTPVKVTTVRGDGFCPSANTEYFDAFNGLDHPTNFNGQTVVLTAEANVTPGTLYHIKLVIADQGDTLYDSAVFLRANSFSSGKDLGEDRLLANGTALCHGESLQLDAFLPSALGYQWFKDGNPLLDEINALYSVESTGDYSVEIKLSSTCFAHGDIRVEFVAPLPSNPITYYQCDDNNDGLTAYYLNLMQADLVSNLPGLEVTSFFPTLTDAQDETNAMTISADEPYYNAVPNEQIFARMGNPAGCFGIVPVILSTPAPFIEVLPAFDVCDDDGQDDGFTTMSLLDIYMSNPPGGSNGTPSFYRKKEDAFARIHPIGTAYTNSVAGGESVYVNLSNDNNEGCFAIMEMPVVVHSFGDGIAPVNAILCEGEYITLNAGNYASYSWDTDPPETTRTITVTTPGIYIATLTNEQGCEATKTFTVLPSGRATGATYEVTEFTGNDNTLSIIPQGPGSYEYSLDGRHFQESPVFDHLPAGEYFVFIRDINGCGPVLTDTIIILDYPLFFTPNGDGINDTWRIPYGYYRPGISVTVFDRYGSLITGFKGDSKGWDGTLNGSPLPATDYWFVVELENGKHIRGHFSLLR